MLIGMLIGACNPMSWPTRAFRHADPNKTISFVGMSLPNIDSPATVVEWTEYFLNASNHAPEARDALQYIGYNACEDLQRARALLTKSCSVPCRQSGRGIWHSLVAVIPTGGEHGA